MQGAVIDKDGRPLKGAVVHLKNLKTAKVKPWITKDDGAFNFAGLDTKTDYQIDATYRGASSKVQTLSALDDSAKILLNLKIASVTAPQPKAAAKTAVKTKK